MDPHRAALIAAVLAALCVPAGPALAGPDAAADAAAALTRALVAEAPDGGAGLQIEVLEVTARSLTARVRRAPDGPWGEPVTVAVQDRDTLPAASYGQLARALIASLPPRP